jgi:hypothetical protein
MDRKIMNIVRRALAEGSDKMCSECGSKMMEGECMECGYMKEGEIEEKLHGKQHRLDKNKNGKIDKGDFAMLRGKRSEMKEGSDSMCECGGMMKEGECMECGMMEGEIEEKLHGKQHRLDKNENGRLDKEDFKMLRKESIYSLELDNQRHLFNEHEIIDIIENIVLEEKKKTKKQPKKDPIKLTKSNQEKSKKENDDYVNSVVKKMKDYLKDASKGEYEMNPKHFPKGNGELAKMDKMAYKASDAVEEYIDNFTAAGLENIDYDTIHPNEEWAEDLLVGASRTGNNPDWANAVETPNNKKRNQIRKDNLLSKLKRKAYNKSPQPVITDKSGSETDKASKIMMKMESTNQKEVISEIEQMKMLIGYGKKTQ